MEKGYSSKMDIGWGPLVHSRPASIKWGQVAFPTFYERLFKRTDSQIDYPTKVNFAVGSFIPFAPPKETAGITLISDIQPGCKQHRFILLD